MQRHRTKSSTSQVEVCACPLKITPLDCLDLTIIYETMLLMHLQTQPELLHEMEQLIQVEYDLWKQQILETGRGASNSARCAYHLKWRICNLHIKAVWLAYDKLHPRRTCRTGASACHHITRWHHPSSCQPCSIPFTSSQHHHSPAPPYHPVAAHILPAVLPAAAPCISPEDFEDEDMQQALQDLQQQLLQEFAVELNQELDAIQHEEQQYIAALADEYEAQGETRMLAA